MSVRHRTLWLEADLIRHAAAGYVNPEPLIQHAQTRAGGSLSREYVTDPMTVRTDQPRLPHTREELADGCINLTWWLEENVGHPSAPRKLRALTYITLAYAELADD